MAQEMGGLVCAALRVKQGPFYGGGSMRCECGAPCAGDWLEIVLMHTLLARSSFPDEPKIKGTRCNFRGMLIAFFSNPAVSFPAFRFLSLLDKYPSNDSLK